MSKDGLLFVVLGLFPVIIITITQMNRVSRSYGYIVTGYSGIMFGFFVYYAAVPILTILRIDDLNTTGAYYKYMPHILDRTEGDYVFAILMIYCALFCIIFTYKRTVRRLYRRVQIHRKQFEFGWETYRIAKKAGIVAFAIGAGSLLLLMVSLGGISSSLRIAETLRQHNVSLSDYTNFGVLYVSAGFSEVAPYLFFFVYQRKKTIGNFICLLFSFGVVALYFAFRAGKSPILLFAITFIYLFFKEKVKQSKHVWSWLIPLGIVMLPILSVLDGFFKWLNTGKMDAISLDYYGQLSGFAAPFTLILNLNDIVRKYGFTFFIGFFQDFLSLLPGVDFPVSYVNTSEFISGTYWQNTGGIPNDFITYGYIQLGILGVIALSCFLGYILAKLDMVVMSVDNRNFRLLFGIIFATKFWGITAGADLRPILQGGFTLIISVIIMFVIDIKYTHISKRIRIK